MDTQLAPHFAFIPHQQSANIHLSFYMQTALAFPKVGQTCSRDSVVSHAAWAQPVAAHIAGTVTAMVPTVGSLVALVARLLTHPVLVTSVKVLALVVGSLSATMVAALAMW